MPGRVCCDLLTGDPDWTGCHRVTGTGRLEIFYVGALAGHIAIRHSCVGQHHLTSGQEAPARRMQQFQPAIVGERACQGVWMFCVAEFGLGLPVADRAVRVAPERDHFDDYCSPHLVQTSCNKLVMATTSSIGVDDHAAVMSGVPDG